MKHFCRPLILLTLLTTLQAHSAILIEDGKAKRTTASQGASDGLSLRNVRRAGIGASAAGPLGFLGANLELNLNSRWGVAGGFGGSPGEYQAYTFQVKHVLAGEWLLPYISFGYSKWYTTGEPKGPMSTTNPAFLADRFLSDRQKDTGDFSVHLIYPCFGLQYMQLDGPWAGSSLYAEILMLIDVDGFESVPTGTLGFLYYF